MFQNKHIAQWALYMTICIFVLTACKNEKVIQDKRKDTKTSESTALPCEQSYIDWNNSVARKNGKLYFAIEIKDFIDAYNYCYYQDYGKKYIQSLVTWYSYKQDFISFCMLSIMSKFLFYVISRILSSIIKKGDSVKGNHWLLFVMPLSSIFCSILIHYLSSYAKNNEFIYVLCFISILLLFAANVIIFQVYSKSSKTAAELYELKAIEQKQELDNTYMQIIEENNNDLKIFCHDIKNHLEQISKLSDDPKIKEYVNSLYGTVNEYSYTGMSDNKVLDIIISKYNSLCQSKRINISFDTKTANLDFMEDIDLSNVMNNLLDNAVEAAEKSSEKGISVSVYSKNNTMQIIKITNSSDTAPKVSEQRLLTSKKNKTLHGLGLTSVKNTLKKYDAILDWNYDEENKSFETTIVFSI